MYDSFLHIEIQSIRGKFNFRINWQGQSMAAKICVDGVNSVNAQTESDSSQTSTSPESSTLADSLSEQQQRQQVASHMHSVVRAARALTTLQQHQQHHHQNRIYGKGADKYYVSAQIIQETKITNCTEITESSVETSNVVQPINQVTEQQQPKLEIAHSSMPQPQPTHHLSPRLEMRLAMNQDILCEEDLMNYDPGPDLTSILGNFLTLYPELLFTLKFNRARPLFIPSNERQRYHNEPDYQHFQQQSEQLLSKQRRAQLILSTKQFKNGHTNTQPKKIKSTYMEQFWICGAR